MRYDIDARPGVTDGAIDGASRPRRQQIEFGREKNSLQSVLNQMLASLTNRTAVIQNKRLVELISPLTADRVLVPATVLAPERCLFVLAQSVVAWWRQPVWIALP